MSDQPIRRVQRDGVEYVLLGTAHVSKASVQAVEELLANERFDAVAVELCPHREKALRDPDAVAHMDLLKVLKEGRAGVVAASLALSAYQRRIAAQLGIEPGAEMVAAMVGAEKAGIPYWLVDRDVGTTMRRARAAVGFWQRAQLTAGLMLSVLEDREIEEAEIEKLKQGDMLQSTFSEFARQSPALYETLINERDRYMAARLRTQAAEGDAKKVLAVVGAGHLEGIERELSSSQAEPRHLAQALGADPPPSQFARWFGYGLMAVLLGLIVLGFNKGRNIGMDVVTIWVLYTSIGGALGAIAALAHPLSILASAIVSPLTPFHIALSSGMFSGASELWLRRPQVGDFAQLREDLLTFRGWWRNRVSRVFLTFMLSNIGTAIGVWIAGARMAARLAQ